MCTHMYAYTRDFKEVRDTLQSKPLKFTFIEVGTFINAQHQLRKGKQSHATRNSVDSYRQSRVQVADANDRGGAVYPRQRQAGLRALQGDSRSRGRSEDPQ